MFEPEVCSEALLLVRQMAEALDPLEELGQVLPDDEVLRAALDVYTARSVATPNYNDSALQLSRIAYQAIVDVRRVVNEADAAVVAAAEQFTREAPGE